MTVAVVVKVFDGIVLAADSATTLTLPGAHQVWNNADKIFHLHRRMPLAMMTWGLGSIGPASIATLAKDFRRRLMGEDADYSDWELALDWTVQGVAERVVEMFYEDLFKTEFPDPNSPLPPGLELGLLVVGYSSGERQAEAWQINITSNSVAPTPTKIIDIEQHGWIAFAQPEATQRLFSGIDPTLATQLQAAVDPSVWATIAPLIELQQRQPAPPMMPFADAIGLARLLVQTTVAYSHYLLGPDTVGGEVEVAGINRHEGFRWINRKHYYPVELNPMGHGHA